MKLLHEYMRRGQEGSDMEGGRETLEECRKEGKERRQGGRKEDKRGKGGVGRGGEKGGGEGREGVIPFQ